MHKRHKKMKSGYKKNKNSKNSNKPFKKDNVFSKTIKSFLMTIKRFRRQWYPLNNGEIKMINQLFEGYHEVHINKKIHIEDVDYIIKKNNKFKFNYTISVDDCWAYDISIRYDGKKNAIIGCSSEQGPLMAHGYYTLFAKEKNRWMKKGTTYWMS